MIKHIKKKKKHGTWRDVLIKLYKVEEVAYLKKLPPIQVVTGIEFKNKDVVDFVDRPKFACRTE